MIVGIACCCFGVGVGASKCGTSWGSPGCPRDTCAWTGPLGGTGGWRGSWGVQMRHLLGHPGQPGMPQRHLCVDGAFGGTGGWCGSRGVQTRHLLGHPGQPGMPQRHLRVDGAFGGTGGWCGSWAVQMRVAVACTGCCCCCRLLVVSVTVMMVVPQFRELGKFQLRSGYHLVDKTIQSTPSC